MKRVGFLGLGHMGRRMAARLVAASVDVKVWSRSGQELAGATRCATPADAARDAEIVVAMVRDDAASEAVWSAARAGLARGAVAVDASTLTPGWVRELGARLADAGVATVDAPVVGSRPQAERGQLVFLAGGSPEAFARAEPCLLAMGARAHLLGPAGHGAAMKLAVNALFAMQVAGLGEILALLGRAGLEGARVEEVLGELAVTSPAMKAAAALITKRTHAPLFPVELALKDLRYAERLAEELDARLPSTSHARLVFEEAVTRGLAAENITSVATLFAPTA